MALHESAVDDCAIRSLPESDASNDFVLYRRTTNDVRAHWLEGGFLSLALLAGGFAALYDWKAAAGFIAAMVAFALLRYFLKKPFDYALTAFVGLAVFNYYYFYCAKWTGRNPTDLGHWGIPATSLEKAQKDIVFFTLLALASVKLFWLKIQQHPLWRQTLSRPLYVTLFCFMAFVGMRSLFWIFQGDSTFDTLFYVRSNLEFAVLPVVLATALISAPFQLQRILKGIIYALPIVAALGIFEFLANASPFERSFYGGHLFSRAASTLQNPNNLGGYLATAIGLYTLFFCGNSLSRWERWCFFPTIGLGLACLFMTLSRSSMLFCGFTLTASLALWYFAAAKRSASGLKSMSWGIAGYAVVVLVSIGLLYQFFDFKEALGNAVDLYVHSSEVSHQRLYAPWIAISALMENPLTALFGYSQSAFPASADNAFANLLVRHGLVGFSLYLCIWLQALWASFKLVFSRQTEIRPLGVACFYVLSFQFIYAFSAPINQNFPHNFYFWLVVGIVACLDSHTYSLDRRDV